MVVSFQVWFCCSIAMKYLMSTDVISAKSLPINILNFLAASKYLLIVPSDRFAIFRDVAKYFSFNLLILILLY
jgi:hypothetical protein